MSVLNIQEQITGGESIYCINESQMARTRGLMDGDDEIGVRLRGVLENLESSLNRNELAALSFTLIERLNGRY
jgi:hypothetical protein